MKLLVPILVIIVCMMPFSNLESQEVIELPITVDANTKWNTAEREYHSKIWDNPVVTNVSKPTMTVFRPATPNGTAVVICPGGGLYGLSIDSEGRDVAKWLTTKGVTAFVLKYRLVPTGLDGTEEIMSDGAQVLVKAKKILPAAVSDGLNAIQHVRDNSMKYGIAKDKIGIIGFSAGGAVTMGATYTYSPKNRPNFIGPIYAWMDVLQPQEVPVDAPPMFALCATDDPLNLAPASVKLYQQWISAKKPAELHMYAKGGHGFGMKKQDLPTDNWIERFGEWLSVQGFMD